MIEKLLTMQYTSQYFIDKFEKIPEERWITNDFSNDIGCCAMGHCGMTYFSLSSDEKEAVALSNLFNDRIRASVPTVNDDRDSNYPQPTPKQRILAALRDIQKIERQQDGGQILSTVGDEPRLITEKI